MATWSTPSPRDAHSESAIFLHVSNGGPTAGCVSVDSQLLDQILTWLDPSARPVIAIGTAAQIAYSGPQ